MAATLMCANVFQICITVNTCSFLFTAKIRITTAANQQYELTVRHFAYGHLSLTKRIFNLTGGQAGTRVGRRGEYSHQQLLSTSYAILTILTSHLISYPACELYFFFIETREFIFRSFPEQFESILWILFQGIFQYLSHPSCNFGEIVAHVEKTKQ